MKYRITPHTTTGQCPAELLMKRPIRSQLDLARPNLKARVQDKQRAQAETHKHAHLREFQIQDAVYARNYARGPQWLPGRVIVKTGPVSYKVELTDGRVWKRHVDQIRKRYNDVQDQTPDLPNAGVEILDRPEVVNEQQPVGNHGKPAKCSISTGGAPQVR